MFENLENTLIEIKDELKLYRRLFAHTLNLKTREAVANFLEVDPKTVYNWTKDGTFKEGVHFFINSKGKKEYIPFAIIEYEKDWKARKSEVKKVEKQLSPLASKFLNGVA